MLWLNALHETLNNGEACVLVTVSRVEGSAPRRVGARMLVSAKAATDTIGGGMLEQQAIEHSQAMLSDASTDQVIESRCFQLGPDLTQCCGGSITLSFEYHPACAFNVVVFGAGHVAQCVAKLLAELPCRAQFYDSRDEWLNKLPVGDDSPTNITSNISAHVSAHSSTQVYAKKLSAKTFLEVEQCPDKAYYLVMTHSHELDFDIVEGVLTRGDSVYCGLIASKSKAAKFRSRLSRKGFTEHELKKLTAPIGNKSFRDNLPMEVAIAAVSEILAVRDAQAALESRQPVQC